jgi:hypothetical protein
MCTKDKGPGNFYQLFKVHKPHTPPNLPPGRPIISGCGSITEKMIAYVDHHAQHLVPELPSYLQDTPDLLRHFEDLNKSDLPANAFPVSIDVVALYSNIPLEERIECFKKALDSRGNKTVPTGLLITLLTLVLSLNMFEFGTRLFQQLIGTAMGTKVAPTFANIFMAKLDNLILKVGNDCIHFFKRFIDDILIIWTGTEVEFLEFMKKINSLHDTIRFTNTFYLHHVTQAKLLKVYLILWHSV